MIATSTKTQACAAPLKLIDAGTIRNDLTRRREIKYAFAGMDVVKLRRLLAANCRRLIHNHQVSVVRSIYFDDATLSARVLGPCAAPAMNTPSTTVSTGAAWGGSR